MDSELYTSTDEALFSERVVAFALDHGVDLDADMMTDQAPEADLATVTALVGSILVQP
jgi:hypothetical protein